VEWPARSEGPGMRAMGLPSGFMFRSVVVVGRGPVVAGGAGAAAHACLPSRSRRYVADRIAAFEPRELVEGNQPVTCSPCLPGGLSCCAGEHSILCPSGRGKYTPVRPRRVFDLAWLLNPGSASRSGPPGGSG